MDKIKEHAWIILAALSVVTLLEILWYGTVSNAWAGVLGLDRMSSVLPATGLTEAHRSIFYV